MNAPALLVLVFDVDAAVLAKASRDDTSGPFRMRAAAQAADASASTDLLAVDAIVASAQAARTLQRLHPEAVHDAALLVVTDDADVHITIQWLREGAQDVLQAADLALPSVGWRLRAAVERKRREREARTAHATDLATGLPHRQQLVEHMSHLMALREREPAPMAVLVLRIEGLESVQARLGLEASNVLRRKLAVRLRAGVRASDVVAALGPDRYAVLLASILEPAVAPLVGAKLSAALHAPFRIAGHDVPVAVALGIAQYPEDGTQPQALLRQASALASAVVARGRAGMIGAQAAGGEAAANDE